MAISCQQLRGFQIRIGLTVCAQLAVIKKRMKPDAGPDTNSQILDATLFVTMMPAQPFAEYGYEPELASQIKRLSLSDH